MCKAALLLCVYLAGCVTVSNVQSYQGPDPGPEAGRVRLIKTATPAFDRYTNSNSPDVQQWIRDRFSRMLVHSPYFDQKTRWYPDSMLYQDLYAIYTNPASSNGYLIDAHPDWVLRDGSGNPLYIPWGCDAAARTCPQYAADFSNRDFRQWWIDNARRTLARGNYLGIWIDDVNLEWRVCDNSGNYVNPMDTALNAPMTIENWRRYMADFLEEIRQALPEIEVLHNSLWFAGGEDRANNYDVRREIRAADYVYLEHGINDSGLQGGSGEWSLEALLNFVEQVNVIGRRVVLAGLGGDKPSDDSVEYAVAGYFLVSNGLNFMGDKRVVTPENQVPVLGVDLAEPQGPRYRWNNLYRRDFANGMVLLNGPDSSTVDVTLPEPYHRVDGTTVTSLTLEQLRGVVLLRGE